MPHYPLWAGLPDSEPVLPARRGSLSAYLLNSIEGRPGSLGPKPPVVSDDALADDDLQLALYICYELCYRGLRGVDPDWEWDLRLLSFRADLERAFLDRLRGELVPPRCGDHHDAKSSLVELVARAGGPSLSTYLLRSGTVDQLREFCIHRSAYQLKEADPHTFAIPRLSGEAKSAMMEIQHDEYGSGRTSGMHSVLFADTMAAVGLDPNYGHYLDRLPGTTLATVNLASMFGLHRRWRGALVGHLAVFEMTSVEPMRRYSQTLERLGIGPGGRRFYDVHVTADARHAIVALERMVVGLLESEPHLGSDLLFGAAAVLLVEERLTRQLLDSWSEGNSSLLANDTCGSWVRRPLPATEESPRRLARPFTGGCLRARAP